MKTFSVLALTAVFLLVMGSASYAATDRPKTTTARVTVGEIFSLTFYADADSVREPLGGPLDFKRVDGSSPSGWYYNAAATLDGNGDPNDGKSDVGLICKSNAHTVASPFYLKIKKSSDTLDTKTGYNVSGAFSVADGTAVDGTVTYPSGFKGSTGIGNLGWGELPTSDATIYQSGTNIYATYGVLFPISFALVPDGLAATSYTTTITYTMVAPV